MEEPTTSPTPRLPSGLPPDQPEEVPIGVPDASPEGEDEPERGPGAMPGIPTDGDPPAAAEHRARPRRLTSTARRRIVVHGRAALAVGVPTLVFGLFALLAIRFGAESRPCSTRRRSTTTAQLVPDRALVARIEDDDTPDDGEPLRGPRAAARAAPAPGRRQPALGAPASASSAAMSPSGVWSAASTSGS